MSDLIGGTKSNPIDISALINNANVQVTETAKDVSKTTTPKTSNDGYEAGKGVSNQTLTSSAPTVDGAIKVNEQMSAQTASDILAVASQMQTEGNLSSEQMEKLMAYMLLQMGKIDRDEAETMIATAQARQNAEASKLDKMAELGEILDLANKAAKMPCGGCGATKRLENKLVEMGYPRGFAKSMAKSMRSMPPQQRFMMAQMLIEAKPQAKTAAGTGTQTTDSNKPPIDSATMKRLMEASKESNEQMMELLLLILLGGNAEGLKQGAQEAGGQPGGQPGAVATGVSL